MKLSSFEKIVSVLNQAKVRYLVVGGMAVNAHGYLRFTVDIDLVIQLSVENIRHVFQSLATLGYRPSVPVTAEQFADPAWRQKCRDEKKMVVLKMWSDSHPETPLDLFIHEPFDFDLEYERAFPGEISSQTKVRFASLSALIEMKRAAGRPQDLLDLEKLDQLAKLKAE